MSRQRRSKRGKPQENGRENAVSFGAKSREEKIRTILLLQLHRPSGRPAAAADPTTPRASKEFFFFFREIEPRFGDRSHAERSRSTRRRQCSLARPPRLLLKRRFLEQLSRSERERESARKSSVICCESRSSSSSSSFVYPRPPAPAAKCQGGI